MAAETNPSAKQNVPKPAAEPSAVGKTSPNVSDRWPRQIKYIVGNEACERFSYYGMRSILAGYITGKVLEGGLGQSPDASTEIIHLFITVNYFMPLLGGWLSDKVVGRYHTILWVSLFYCAGHGVLACSDFAGGVHGKMICLFIGLALIAFGSGGIKPCVSAFVGDQFTADQGHLLQKAYGAFYWSINLGSFFSFLVIPFVKNHHGYSAAFAVPGILMAIATFVFWLGRNQYHRVPPSRETKNAGFFKVFFHALTTKRQPGQSFWDAARNRFTEQEVDSGEIRRSDPGSVPFDPAVLVHVRPDKLHMGFAGLQNGSRDIFGYQIGAEEMQSMNPLLVMILVPVMTLLIYPPLGRFASPLRRMSSGMFLGAASFLVVAWLQQLIDSGHQLSVMWQTVPYLVLTIAEVLVSTTGLEFAFREAAPEMKSLIMSFFLLTVSAGDLLVAVVTKIFSTAGNEAGSISAPRFVMYAGLTFVVAILFSLATIFYQYRDKSAAEGK